MFVVLVVAAIVAMALTVAFGATLLVRRTSIVVAIGVGLWLAATLADVLTPCGENASDCYQGVGAVLALFALAGWVGGVGLANLVRRRRAYGSS